MGHRTPVRYRRMERRGRPARRIFLNGLLLSTMLLALVIGPAEAAQDAAAPVYGQPPAQGFEPVFEPGPCDFPDTTNLAAQMPLECGTVRVPEQWSDPGGPTIELAVAVLRSSAPNRDPVPMLLLQGGPGGSTINLYLYMIPLIPSLRELDRDIILFDQRGTMYSEPNLFCEETYQLGIDLLDEDIPDEEADARYFDALARCKDRLAQETDLSAYDSLENAADVDAVRRALGYEQMHLYGVSYGTQLALYVMRLFPEGLASVTLDSVIPPQVDAIADQPRILNRGLKHIFDACAQDEACSRAYPDLEEVFYAQIDRLNQQEDPIQVQDFQTGTIYPALLDGDTVMYLVIQMLYTTDLIPLIPRTIYQIRNEDYRVASTLISNMVFDRSVSYGMYYAVFCAEENGYDPAAVNLEGLPPALYDDQKDSVEQFKQVCDLFNVEPLDPASSAPVQSDVPTLVLSGAFDPVTPPEYGEAAAETLTHAYSYVVPTGGHSQLASGACPASLVVQFMDDPSRAPDASCLEEMRMEFSTPGALVVFPKLIDLLNPQGTDLTMLLVYGLSALLLLSAILIYPLVWLARKFSGPKPAAQSAAATQMDQYGVVIETPDTPLRKPMLYRLGPWLAGITGVMLVVFLAVVFAVALQMALNNDNRVLFGLPGSARPLFLLPLLALVAVVLMLAGAASGWARGAGSLAGRIYFTLLVLAGIAAVAVLVYLGAVQALFIG